MNNKITIDGIEYVRADSIKTIEVVEEFKFNEKDYIALDNANVICIGRVQNLDEDSKPMHLVNDFEKENRDVSLWTNLKDKEVISVYKGEELWCRFSEEYYTKAKKIFDIWGEEISVYVQKEKNMPVLFYGGGQLGLVLAPRIQDE